MSATIHSKHLCLPPPTLASVLGRLWLKISMKPLTDHPDEPKQAAKITSGPEKCVSRVLVTSDLQPQHGCARVGSLVTLNPAPAWWDWAAGSARPVTNPGSQSHSLKLEKASEIIHAHWITLGNVISARFFNNSKDGGPRTSLGSPIQCLTTFPVPILFSNIQPNFSYYPAHHWTGTMDSSHSAKHWISVSWFCFLRRPKCLLPTV